MNLDRERRSLRLKRRTHLEAAHREWLQAVELKHLFSGIGREETFTGVLLASLLNPLSRPVVLRGLGITDELELVSATSAALPIDLVLTFVDSEQRTVPVVIEVKWADSESNYPGYLDNVKGQPSWDDAPSQLDRAHQLTQTSAFASHDVYADTECQHCGFPNVCPEHGCLRGCLEDGSEICPPWTDRPAIYPRAVQAPKPRWWDEIDAKPEDWRYVFLDYDGRPAYDPEGDGAFFGVCSEAWLTSSMDHLANTLREHYAANASTSSAKSLEPLLVVLFAQ